QGQGGGERRLDGLGALVLSRFGKAGAVESLRVVIAREHAESDRDEMLAGDIGEAQGHGLAHVFEVRSRSLDDHAESGNRVDTLAGKRLRHDGELDGASNAGDAIVGPRGLGRPDGASNQAVHDLGVPLGRDDLDRQALGVNRELGCTGSAHEFSSMMWPMRRAFVRRYAAFSGCSPTCCGSRSTTSLPEARDTSTLAGLFVSSWTLIKPRSARIAAAAPYSRRSTGRPRSVLASTVSRPLSCSA